LSQEPGEPDVPTRPVPPDIVLKPSVPVVVLTGVLSAVMVAGAAKIAADGPPNPGDWVWVGLIGVLIPFLLMRGVLTERFEIHGGMVVLRGFGPPITFPHTGILEVHRSGGRYRPAHFVVTPEVGRLAGRRRKYRTIVSVPSNISTRKIARALGLEALPYSDTWWPGAKIVKHHYAPPLAAMPVPSPPQAAAPAPPAGPPATSPVAEAAWEGGPPALTPSDVDPPDLSKPPDDSSLGHWV
jgi:hypothetical protein